VNVIGIVMIIAGLGALGIGAWSAATGRRPVWLSTKAIAANTVRTWGAGTGLAGAGLAIVGVSELVAMGTVPGLAGFVLIMAGAGLVTVSTPRRGRSGPR
jgi:hypothetical protein